MNKRDCLDCGQCESCIDRSIAAADDAQRREKVWFFIKALNRLGMDCALPEAKRLAHRTSDPDLSYEQQMKAFRELENLIGE